MRKAEGKKLNPHCFYLEINSGLLEVGSNNKKRKFKKEKKMKKKRE